MTTSRPLGPVDRLRPLPVSSFHMQRVLIVIGVALSVFLAPGVVPADTIDDLERAYHAQRQGDYDTAIDYYSRLLKGRTLRTSQRAVVYLLRGESYKDKGEFGRAIRDFERALKLKPNYPQAYFFRGVCHEAEGRLDEAIKDVAKALELNPDRELYEAKLARLRAAKEKQPPTKLNTDAKSNGMDKKPKPPEPKPE